MTDLDDLERRLESASDVPGPYSTGRLCRDAADAIAQLRKVRVPEGWVLVRPTDLEKLRELSGAASQAEANIDPDPQILDPASRRAHSAAIAKAKNIWREFDTHLDGLIAASPQPPESESNPK